jgi:hypothetical protein
MYVEKYMLKLIICISFTGNHYLLSLCVDNGNKYVTKLMILVCCLIFSSFWYLKFDCLEDKNNWMVSPYPMSTCKYLCTTESNDMFLLQRCLLNKHAFSLKCFFMSSKLNKFGVKYVKNR